MKDIDTLRYTTELSNGEVMQFQIAFTKMEPKEAFINRCALMWESMQEAKRKMDQK